MTSNVFGKRAIQANVHEQTASPLQTASSHAESRIARVQSLLVPALAALVVVAIVGWQLQLIGDYRVDDAYLSFSFAKNLAAGNGLTYGAGLKVEGYSNFLWTIVAAVVRLIAPDQLYSGMRCIGFACFGAALWLTFSLSRRHMSNAWAFGSVVLLACASDMTGAVQSGLETVPYTAALLATVYCYVREDSVSRRSSGWCLLLLGLLRIDGIVHIAFFLGWTALSCLFEWRPPRVRQTIRWLAPGLSLYALYFGWRYLYYGLPLPTTYYAKSSIATALPYHGLQYVLDAALQLGFPIAMLFAAFGLGRRLSNERALLAALFACHLSYVTSVGGDWMPFHRFVLPVLPLLLILFTWGVSDAWQRAQSLHVVPRLLVLNGLLACMVIVLRMEDAHSIETGQERGERDLRAQVARHTRDLVQSSRLFRWMTRRPGEKLVSDYGGVFAYFTDADIIEMWGLCNADIALRGTVHSINPLYGKTCIPCYAEFNPVYFHANTPLLRRVNDLKTQEQVFALIFQGLALDKVVHFRDNFVAGRVVDNHGFAFYFIERRRAGESFEPRHPAPGITVEYPFL